MLDVFLMALAAVPRPQDPALVRIEFHRLLPSWIRAASSDGRWITGDHPRSFSGKWPFRWNLEHGMEGLGAASMEGRAISDDGEKVLTRVVNGFAQGWAFTAALWTPDGLVVFPGHDTLLHSMSAQGVALSRNGRFVAGWGGNYASGTWKPPLAWVWEVGGHVRVLDSPWSHGAFALDVSDDGRVAVGQVTHYRQSVFSQYPAIWSDGSFELLSKVPGGAYGSNQDGSVVVGETVGLPFLWRRAHGMRRLETVPPNPVQGWYNGFRARQVSDDGSTVLTQQYLGSVGQPELELAPHLWREGAGAVHPDVLLAALGAQLPDDVLGLTLDSLGADGRTLVGSAWTSARPEDTYLVWRAELPSAAEVYCSSQTSVGGCTPSIGFAGTPSARTGEGFPITVLEVPPDARGVLAYGTAGWAAVPFGGGVLCVAEPTTRVALGAAAGAQACEGALAIDFNNVVAAAGDPALIGGAHVWAQAWIRDPAAPPPQLLLSDALVFTLWP